MTKNNPAVVAIVARVAALYGVSTEDILGRCRSKTIAEARAVSMWLARNRLGWSFPELGRAFDRDHTTVMSACRSVDVRRAIGNGSKLMLAAVTMFTDANLATADADASSHSAERGAA